MAARKKAKPKKRSEWHREALRLHVLGYDVIAIAEQLKQKPDTVRQAIAKELAKTTSEYADQIKQDRAIAAAQLDFILQGHLEKAHEGDKPSGFLCAALLKEKSKLLGLNAPEKIDINAKLSFDDVDDLEQRIAKLVAIDGARHREAEGSAPGAGEADPAESPEGGAGPTEGGA